MRSLEGCWKGDMKNKEKVINQYYLNINDIRVLLGISYQTAKRVYDKANEIDEEKFREFRVEPKKVSMKSVLEVNHLTLKDIKKA